MPPISCSRRPVLALLAASMVPATVRAAAASAQVTAAVERAFAPLMAAHDIPGMAVGVTLGGRRHVFNYGVAARPDGAPVDGHTLFEIGSLSKPFTATLAGYAEALGKLSLQDRVERWVPALRGTPVGAARLLHLGTYTAGGLPLQFPAEVRSLEDALGFFRGWEPTAAPGEQRRYSNPSIGLLGHATALAMQRDYVELVQGELLGRLGLRDTFIDVPPPRRLQYAWGSNKDHQRLRVNPGVFDAQAYGLKTTVGDLLRFVEANLSPATRDPVLQQAVQSTHAAHFRVGPMVQGLGWEQYPYPVPLERLLAGNSSSMALAAQGAQALAPGQHSTAPTLFNKTGSTNGFGGYAAFVPARQIGVVMLANRNIPNAARITAAHAVLEALAPPQR